MTTSMGFFTAIFLLASFRGVVCFSPANPADQIRRSIRATSSFCRLQTPATQRWLKLGIFTRSNGFSYFAAIRHRRSGAPTPSSLSFSSRLEGNQRLPSADETAVMDEMIDKLLDAKPYELPSAVKRAFQVIRSPQFFLRIAQRSDSASSEEEKQRYQILASNLVTTLEAVVETTTEQLDERAQAVENVVKAAAEPESGEFLVPLTPERIEAMQTAIRNVPESTLDEGFLVTLDAWIVKSHQDGMDGMVGILQKVLQMYAGLAISRALHNPKQAAEQSQELEQLLAADESAWNAILGSHPKETLASLRKTVQRIMETVVLSLETGSMTQQVQAEYLKELLKRVETAENQ